jgi:ABC-type multidrug transport system ATPase subunit
MEASFNALSRVLPKEKKGSDIVKRLLRDLELEAYANALPDMLSGGMKQRVSLCRAILAKSRILLLDEPFKELDGALHERLRSILAKEAKERLIILTAHNLDALGDLKRTVVPIV